MPELTDQLREEFRTAADEVEPGDGLDTRVRGRARQRQLRRRTARLGGVVAVLALIALVAPRALGGDGPNVLSGPAAPAGEAGGVYLVPDWLPAGFDLAQAAEVTFPEGGGSRTAGYRHADGRSLAVGVHQAPTGATTTSVPDPTSHAVTVRGHDGWVIDAPLLLSSDGSTEGRVIVEWEERPGARVSVAAAGLAEDDVLRVAEGLRSVSADSWRALVDPVLESSTPATITTSAPASTSTPTTAPTATSTSAPTATTTASPPAESPPPAPEAESSTPGDTVEGSYSGTEHYTLGTAECPDMDHTFDAVVTASDGTAWSFHEDYCGRVVDDWWSGEGTFTLTGPEGDVLEGSFTSEASAVGDGAPYDLTITGGAGAYAGAGGTCRADNHVERVSFGTQRHSGTLTCEVTLG